MTISEKPGAFISCCGFYCKTCKEYKANLCRGCKLGYEKKQRDINKAKCKIKLCCIKKTISKPVLNVKTSDPVPKSQPDLNQEHTIIKNPVFF